MSKRNAMKSKGIDKHEAKELSQAPGEVYAAISMALHEMQDEVHDVEETVLTITRVNAATHHGVRRFTLCVKLLPESKSPFKK